jgi:putative endonuclease
MARVADLAGRRKALRRGAVAEYVAAFWLLARGYRIVAMRYRTRSGEIDIIARKGKLAVFVEVKARSGPLAAVNAVSYPSQKRIRAASDHWLSRQRDAALLSRRYDIIAVNRIFWPVHFKDAF